MERRKRWDAAAAKETVVFRKYEKRYFHKKLAYRIVLGLFLYGFGACLILSLYLTAEEQYRNRRYENIFMTALLNQKNMNGDTEVQETQGSVDPGSYIAGTVIWSVLFLGGYGYYLCSLVQSHQEFQKRYLYCRRTACVGKEDFRISACVDLMTEEGKILEGLTVPLYVLSELELHKPVYLVTTDPKAFYEQADIYPSPYPEKNPLDLPDAAEFFFRR